MSICNCSPFIDVFKPDLENRRSVNEKPMYHEIGQKRFWFLISEHLKTVVDLSFIFLFPYEIGTIVVSGGDIDNRLKTMFDALRIPHNENEIPRDDDFDYNKGMYCLLEDDKLINKLDIQVFQDHYPINEKSCRVLIKVRTRITSGLWNNLSYV